MMKSYTLSNWDGSLGGSEEKPQTVANGQTSAHALPSNLQPSASNHSAQPGNNIGNTIYGGEHGKEESGMDKRSQHDASIEGGSRFDVRFNGERHNMEGLSSSSQDSFVKGQGEVMPWTSETGHSAKNASYETQNLMVQDSYAPLQSSFVPQNHARVAEDGHIPRQPPQSNRGISNKLPSETSSDVAAVALNRDILSIPTTVHLSPKHIQTHSSTVTTEQEEPMFIPNPTFSLHSALSRRRSPVSSNPSQTNILSMRMLSPLSSIHLPSELSSPVSEKSHRDAVSVHTADGEGTDEDDEVIILENIPSNFSSRPHPEENIDSLFTPPPSEKYVAVEDLFTPPPPKKRKSSRPKTLFTYVLLPPLRRPRTDYLVRPRPPKKIKRRPAQVQEQSDLARAMQASFEHNDTVGTLPQKKKKILKPQPPRPPTKETKRQESRASVAGPSRPSSQSISASRNVQQRKRRRNDDDDWEASSSVSKKPRIRPNDVDDWETGSNVSKKPSVTTVDIDLTLSDEDERLTRRREEKAKQEEERKIKPKPKVQRPVSVVEPPARPPKTAGKDRYLLTLGAIKQTLPGIVYHNTRHIRHRCLGPTYQDLDDQWSTASKGRKKVKANAWRGSLVIPASEPDCEAEFSLGGRLVWEEDDESDHDHDDNDDDDDVEIVTNGTRQESNPSVSAPPSAVLPPPMIDLGEQLKKRRQNTRPSAKRPRSSAAAALSTPSTVSPTRPTNSQVQPLTPTAAFINDIFELPITPSAKALGKRKAVTPGDSPTSVYRPALSLAKLSFEEQSLNSAANSSALLHEISSFHQVPSTESNTINIIHLQQQIFVTPSQLIDGTILGSIPTNPHSYTSSHAPNALRKDVLLSGSGDQHNVEPEPYPYETINPMLLGGHSLEPSFQDEDTYRDPEDYQVPNIEEDADLALEFNDIFQMPPSPPASHVSAEQDEGVTSTIFSQTIAESKETQQALGASPSPTPSTSDLPRLSAHETTSEYTPSSPRSNGGDDGAEGDVIVATRRQFPPTQAPIGADSAQASGRSLTKRNPFEPQGIWPQTDEYLMCHQCRNRSYIRKWFCRCGKKYCFRCLKLRYEDKVFDMDGEQATCPFCDNYCSCSQCRFKKPKKKKIPSPPEMEITESSTDLGSVSQRNPLKRTVKAPKSAPVPPQNAQYWGAIYSLDGRKIGTTFAAPAEGGDELPSVVFSRVYARPQLSEKTKRTFVGKSQRIWGFNRNVIPRDLQPIPPNRTKASKYASHIDNTRVFAGSSAFLRYRVKSPAPDSDSSDLDTGDELIRGLSPLTVLSDSDDCDGKDNPISEGEVFIPGCLEERDVARAIAASFMSIGINPIFEPSFLLP
ncbi:hypothetical protein BDN70DRAFT_886790 [Pholiota conissans]|uniref:Zinc-finger domain-containing protein n=1 Tax=Pholiota conissans TaxID=109636 RepID=A0A9P5YMS1_9AGAR|nr:hypothetical protein BDN70DRAFT_886790 [Pholiota conissans]